MHPARLLAGALGFIYAVAGVVGFFATGFGGSGRLLIFDVSVAHNLANLAIGLTGVGAYMLGPAAGRAWAQGAGVVLAVMAVVGVVESNPLGVIPMGGADIALHALSALPLLYFGFAEEGVPEEPDAYENGADEDDPGR